MNLIERVIARQLSLSTISSIRKGGTTERQPLDWRHRQGSFVFNSKSDSAINYTVVLIDKIKIEGRVLLVTKVPKHAICSEILPYDVAIGFAGFDFFYEELIRRHGSPWSGFPVSGKEYGSRAFFWHDYSKDIGLLGDSRPFINLHVPGEFAKDLKAGERIQLEGVSCKIFIGGVGEYEADEMTTTRCIGGFECMSFWPSFMPIEQLCDDFKAFPEIAVRQIVKDIYPQLYLAEEAQEKKVKIALAIEHQNRAADLLK